MIKKGFRSAFYEMRMHRGKNCAEFEPVLGIHRSQVPSYSDKDHPFSVMVRLADLLGYRVAFIPKEDLRRVTKDTIVITEVYDRLYFRNQEPYFPCEFECYGFDESGNIFEVE